MPNGWAEPRDKFGQQFGSCLRDITLAKNIFRVVVNCWESSFTLKESYSNRDFY